MRDINKPIEVIVAGHLCLDLNPAFSTGGSQSLRDILIPGKLINVGQAALSTGGAVSNTGLSLRMLGIRTSLMGKIGSDLLGDTVRKILTQYDAADGLIVDPGSATSYSIVLAPPGIDRIFLHHPGSNDTFCASDLNQDLLASCRLFHFGYPPLMQRMYQDGGDELARVFRLARAGGATTSLDLALPDPASAAGQADWPLILGKVLPLTDIFVPSLEELLFMLDRAYFDQLKELAGDQDICDHYDYGRLPGLADRLLAMGISILAIKLGRRGFYVRTGSRDALDAMGPAGPAHPEKWADREIWSETFDVPREKIASTSGAGDASIAGFLAGLISGASLESACELACAVAGLKIQVKTSVGGILPLDEVLARIPGWAKEPLELDRTFWHYDPEARLWFGPVRKQGAAGLSGGAKT
jgi:sugar/nucleoside kinase (ribokinase family)